MKCICGYEHGRKWVDNEIVEVVGKEGSFKTLSGKFYVEEEYESDRVVALYACPKCHTVQLRD